MVLFIVTAAVGCCLQCQSWPKGRQVLAAGWQPLPFHAQMWVASGGGCPVTCTRRPLGATAFSSQHCAWCPSDKGAGD